MRGWFESTFGAGALAAQFVVALIVVIVLFAVIAAFARRRNKNTVRAQARGRQPRLAVMDMAVVDDRRKLLLIRRDNVEHLVMIGGPSDVVIENAIVRNRPTPQVSAPRAADRVSERTPDRPLERTAAGLATPAHSQAHSKAQVRAPSASPAGSGDRSGDGPGEARTAPPLRGPQFVNPYKPPELPRKENKPSPAATSVEPFRTPSPAASPAAVAGLAAGAAALTAAAAAKVKRHEPSPETPPEKLADAPPILPAGINGSGDLTTPATDIASDTGAETVTPEPTTPEPVVSEDAAEAAKEPYPVQAAETATETSTEPVAAADATHQAPPAADAQASTDSSTDTGAAEHEQKTTDETPVTESAAAAEPGAAAEPEQVEAAELAGETSPGESREESRLQDAVADDAVDDNLEAAFAQALVPPQDQSAEVADTTLDAAEPTPAEPADAARDLTDAATELATEESSEVAAEPTPAKSFEEVMAEHISSHDPAIVTPPQADAPISPEPEPAAASGDTETDAADKTAEPAAERPAAISPFPTIPEDVRRSVLEAAQRAVHLTDTDPGSAAQAGTADGAAKTTLGDLAERLEQALAEQASTLSGQVKSAADVKPAPAPAEGRTASIEEWERGELTSADAQGPDSPPEADASADADSEAAPRQSQAMLEDETDSGVIDFSDRKKAAPENTPSDSLEDEMARLLGELTSGNSGG